MRSAPRFCSVDASAPAFCSSQLCAMPRLIRIKSAASAVGDHSADAPLSDKTTHKSSQIQIHKECGTTSSLFYPLFGKSWLQSSFAFQSFPIDQKNVWMFKCFSISQLIGWIGACVDKGEINETLDIEIIFGEAKICSIKIIIILIITIMTSTTKISDRQC